MDTRTARRAAEKAARDLINSRATLIGELGVAQAERTQLDADVAAAAERGRQLIAEAQDEAARLLETVQTAVRDADQRYTDVYGAATAAGWAPADLSALGFQPNGNTSPRRRRPAQAENRPAASPPAPPTAHADVPQQHSHPEAVSTPTPA